MQTDDQKIEAAGKSAIEQKRRVYLSPRLIEFGTIGELTKAQLVGGSDGNPEGESGSTV